MTRPDLDAIAALLDKANERHAGDDLECLLLDTQESHLARDMLLTALPELLAYVRELEKELIPPTPRSVVIERARNRIAELEQERDAALARVRELEAGRDSANDEETGRTLTAWQWKARYQDCEMSYRNASAAWNTHTHAAALAMRERCAQACMKATPDRAAVKAIGEAAHYAACAAAIRALEL